MALFISLEPKLKRLYHTLKVFCSTRKAAEDLISQAKTQGGTISFSESPNDHFQFSDDEINAVLDVLYEKEKYLKR